MEETRLYLVNTTRSPKTRGLRRVVPNSRLKSTRHLCGGQIKLRKGKFCRVTRELVNTHWDELCREIKNGTIQIHCNTVGGPQFSPVEPVTAAAVVSSGSAVSGEATAEKVEIFAPDPVPATPKSETPVSSDLEDDDTEDEDEDEDDDDEEEEDDQTSKDSGVDQESLKAMLKRDLVELAVKTTPQSRDVLNRLTKNELVDLLSPETD